MNKLDIIKKIPKLPLPEIYGSDIRLVLTLATVIATTHMVNRIEKVVKSLDKQEHSDTPIIFK